MATKYFHYYEDICETSYDSFISFVNANPDDDWQITLHCDGGKTTYAHHIAHILNSRKERNSVVCLTACSAAFLLLLKLECKIMFAPTTVGMFHYGFRKIHINEGTKKGEYVSDNFLLDNVMPGERKDSLVWAEKIMTPKEMKRFKKGEYVYFNVARMREIFPHAEVI